MLTQELQLFITSPTLGVGGEVTDGHRHLYLETPSRLRLMWLAKIWWTFVAFSIFASHIVGQDANSNDGIRLDLDGELIKVPLLRFFSREVLVFLQVIFGFLANTDATNSFIALHAGHLRPPHLRSSSIYTNWRNGLSEFSIARNYVG